jgi:hypothetical protein
MLEVLELGLDGFVLAHAYPSLLESLGSMRVTPELPVQVVQPVHLAVSCQCVPLDLLPLLRSV